MRRTPLRVAHHPLPAPPEHGRRRSDPRPAEYVRTVSPAYTPTRPRRSRCPAPLARVVREAGSSLASLEPCLSRRPRAADRASGSVVHVYQPGQAARDNQMVVPRRSRAPAGQQNQGESQGSSGDVCPTLPRASQRAAVDFDTPHCRAASRMVSVAGTPSGRGRIRRRPSRLPCALARARPALTRSAMRHRSNSLLCGAPHKSDYAEWEIMRSDTAGTQVSSALQRCCTPHYPGLCREAISASGAVNRPRRNPGGRTISIASSFSDRSTRR